MRWLIPLLLALCLSLSGCGFIDICGDGVCSRLENQLQNCPRDCTPGTIDTTTTTTISAPRVMLSWKDNSDNEDGFEIWRSTSNNFSHLDNAPGNAQSYLDHYVSRGVSYVYKVRAYGLDGSSAFSNEAALETRQPGLSTQALLSQYNQRKDASTLAQLSVSLEKRKSSMKALMKENPADFLSKTTNAQLYPSQLWDDIEQPSAITGTVEVTHFDDFAREESKEEYKVDAAGEKVELYPTEGLRMVSGTRVSVKGYRIDNQVAAYSKDIKVLSEAQKESLGMQNTLVILLRYSNDFVGEPFSRIKFEQEMKQGIFKRYYDENSYGKTIWNLTILNWTTLPRPGINCDMVRDNELSKIIKDNQLNLSDYQRILYVSTVRDCWYAGVSGVGRSNYYLDGKTYSLSISSAVGVDNIYLPDDPYSMSDTYFVIAHELGHALGVMHASRWFCRTGDPLYGDCNHIEYGNFLDVMGDSSYAQHFNAAFKEQLGWIEPNNIVEVRQSGRYIINPLETVGGFKAAKIFAKGDASPFFYIELRKPIGFDIHGSRGSTIKGFDSGLTVNWVSDQRQNTRLLDLSTFDPYKVGENHDPTLKGTYIVDDKGVTIKFISTDANSATFDVALADQRCVPRPPRPSAEFVNGTYTTIAKPGGISSKDGNFINMDNKLCKKSRYKIMLRGNTSWNFSMYGKETPFFMDLGPEETFYFTFEAHVPRNISIDSSNQYGFFPIKLIILNMNNSLNITRRLIVPVTEPLKFSLDPESLSGRVLPGTKDVEFARFRLKTPPTEYALDEVAIGAISSRGNDAIGLENIRIYLDQELLATLPKVDAGSNMFKTKKRLGSDKEYLIRIVADTKEDMDDGIRLGINSVSPLNDGLPLYGNQIDITNKKPVAAPSDLVATLT